MTAASGGTVADNQYVVTFALTNKAGAKSSPAVSVSAEIKNQSVSVGLIANAAMDKPGTALYGVANGATR